MSIAKRFQSLSQERIKIGTSMEAKMTEKEKRTTVSKRDCKSMVDSDRLGQVRMKTEQHKDRSEGVIKWRTESIEDRLGHVMSELRLNST